MVTVKKTVFLSIFSMLAACSNLEHEAPYDPDAPVSKQAKGELKGTVELAGEAEHSQVSVTVSGVSFETAAQTAEDGSFRIAPVTPGPLTIAFTFRGYETQTQTLTLDVGQKLDLGTITLEPKKVSVSGSAVAQLQSATAGKVTEGGVTIVAERVGGVKDLGASSAPALFPLAATSNNGNGNGKVADYYSTTSDDEGGYTLELPSGNYVITGSDEGAPFKSVAVEVSGEEDVEVESIVLLPVTGLLNIKGIYGTGPTVSTTYTASRSVTLELLGFNASEMRVAEGTTCGDAAKQPYTASLALQLSAGDGVKNVCVRYVEGDEETGDITASITLDGTAPANPAIDTQSGVTVTKTDALRLVLAADETGSGLDKVELREGMVNEITSFRSFQPYTLVDTNPGAHTITARFIDKAGNYSAPASITVDYDNLPPVVGTPLRINGGAAGTNSRQVTLTIDATGAAEMMIGNEGSFTGAQWETFRSSLTWMLVDIQGARTVHMKLRDAAGNELASPEVAGITLDSVAPSSPSIGISGGGTYTNAQTVTLALSAANADWMQLSNDGAFDTEPQLTYGTSTTWNVTSGEGQKVIYARFGDTAGNVSGTVSTFVVLDTSGPESAAVSIDGGSAYNTHTGGSALLSLSSTDARSGVSRMKVANLSSTCAAAIAGVIDEPFVTTKSWALASPGTGIEGPRWVCAAFQDGAGNWGAPVSDAIGYDTLAPVAGTGLLINGGDTHTTSSQVTLSIDATGASEMLIGNDGSFTGAQWEPFRSSVVWFLVDQQGSRSVSVKLRDAAGNEIASPLVDGITLDSVAPSSPSVALSGGAMYVNSQTVTLALSALNADWMQLSNDGAFDTEPQLTYGTSTTWNVSSGEGQKIIYARFGDTAGNVSGTVSTFVIVDTSAPVAGSIAIDGGSAFNTQTLGTSTLALSSTDTGSGVARMKIANLASTCAAAVAGATDEPYSTTKAWFLANPAAGIEAPRWVCASFRDGAGNWSAPVSDVISYDTLAPAGTIKVAGGNDFTASQFVTVATTASADAAKILLANNTTASSCNPSVEYTYSAGVVWSLDSAATTQWVCAKFVDAAGNQSVKYLDAVTFDTEAPIVSSFSLDVTKSTTALALSWRPVSFAGVTGYRWYRILDGTTTLGGQVAVTSVSVPNPLDGETYAVTVTYASGVESALSNPAVEKGARTPAKSILVVDDDGGANAVETNLLPLLAAAGFTIASGDVFTVGVGSDGPTLAQMNDYALVVWSTGESTALPILSGRDRDALEGYLSAGGNLWLLSPTALDDTNTAAFVANWAHSGRIQADMDGITNIYGVAGDVVSDGVDFPVGPEMTGADSIAASPLSSAWLESGDPVAIRYPASGAAAYRMAWQALPTSGLWNRNVARLNTATLELPFSGVDLNLGDNTSVPMTLPFDIRFGSLKTNQVFVGSNGVVSFGTPVNSPVPFPTFPAGGPTTAVIAAAWQDLHPEAGGRIYVVTAPTEVTVVWDGVPNRDYSGVVTTAVRFHASEYIDIVSITIAQVTGETYWQAGFQDDTGRSNIAMGFPFDFGGPRTCMSNCGYNAEMFAFSFSAYFDTVQEFPPVASRLVRWLSPPAGVSIAPVRYFGVNSSVSGAYEMRVSTDGVLDTEGWIAYDGSYPVSYPAGDGTKSVKVEYRDRAGNTTVASTDSVELDTEAPSLTAVLLSDANNGSNAFSRTRTVTMQLVGSATTSDYMRASESAVFVDAGWTPYVESSTFTLSEGDGAKLVYVWLKDANGNISPPAVGAIVADTSEPETVAVADRAANRGPVYVNASYREESDSETFASLPSGTLLGISNDIPLVLKELPFSFSFYGRSRSSVIIFKNGMVAFNITQVDRAADPARDEADPYKIFDANTMAAPLLQPIALRKAGHGVYYAQGATWVVVRWIGEDPRTQAPVQTAVKLLSDGTIKFLYGTGNLDLDALVGISKGDGKNRHFSRYSDAEYLPNASSVRMVPNSSDVNLVTLYYRYHYETGPGSWINSGASGDSIFDALEFYPPLGTGTYDFYTNGVDSAGNQEAAPAQADASIVFDDIAPQPPASVEAQADDDSVFIRWDASDDADVVAYKVYYGPDANFAGTDAIEGDSPIQYKAQTFARLSGFETGSRLYVTVTAIDHVGNESDVPGGAVVFPPRALRKLTFIPGGYFKSPYLRDNSLWTLENAGPTSNLRWYDLTDPANPQLLHSAATFGTGFLLADQYVYASDVSFDVSTYGQFTSLAGTFDGGFDMAVVSPNAVLSYDSDDFLRNVSIVNGAVLSNPAPFTDPYLMDAERSMAVAVGSNGCCSGPWYAAPYTYSASGLAYAHPQLLLPYQPKDIDIAGGLMLTAQDFDNGPAHGWLEVFDVSNPSSISNKMTVTDYNPLTATWIGDRIAFADYFGLNFLNVSDMTAPIRESALQLDGFPVDLAFSGTVGVATLQNGIEVFEVGELLPTGIKNREVPLLGQISAIATKGQYAFVANETVLDVYSLASVSTSGPVLIARYTPFVGVALVPFSTYLAALDEGFRLNIFDVANPASPRLVWRESAEAASFNYYNFAPNSLEVLGSVAFLVNRAYDLSDPLHPKLLSDYTSETLHLVRGGGGLLYGARFTGETAGNKYYRLRVYDADEEGDGQIGELATPLRNVLDFVADGRYLYLYQGAPDYKIRVIDVSDPAEPELIAEYPIADLGYAPGGRYLAASRGFLYLSQVNTLSNRMELMQIDLRNPRAPVFAFKYESDGSEYLGAPYAITKGEYLLSAGSRSLNSFRISANVPVVESRYSSSSLSGTRLVAIGDRYVYYAGGSTISVVERRAPVLSFSAIGAGEVAIVKNGNKLMVYDPPGIPASELTADRTGQVDLTLAAVDTIGELCTLLNSTGRISCTMSPWASSSMSSSSLIDTFGMRLKNDAAGVVLQTDSLRAPRVLTTVSMGAGNSIRALEFDNHRLFAGVVGPQNGLYVIDPVSLTLTRHAIGDVTALAVRDSMAYVGRKIGVTRTVIGYHWPTSAIRGTLATSASSGDITALALDHGAVYYIEPIYISAASKNNVLKIATIDRNGKVTAAIQAFHYYDPNAKIVAIGPNRIAWYNLDEPSGKGILYFFTYTISPASGAFEQAFEVGILRNMKVFNGKLVTAKDDLIRIMDIGTLPPTNHIERELKLPGGAAYDFDVLGDLLSVAADSGGAVAYRLK